MTKILITDIEHGKIMIDVENIKKIYKTKIEDNFDATAVSTDNYVYYTHEKTPEILGLYDAANN